MLNRGLHRSGGPVGSMPIMMRATFAAPVSLPDADKTWANHILTVEKARSALQSATQAVGANSSQVEISQASLTQAKINLKNVQVQSARIFELDQKGLVAKAGVDDMRADLATAESKVAGAQADLEKARQQLGDKGADNPQIRSAIAQLGGGGARSGVDRAARAIAR